MNPHQNPRLSKHAESTREMVDAIRTMLGMDPLYQVNELAAIKRDEQRRRCEHEQP